MDTATWIQNLDETVCKSQSTNTLQLWLNLPNIGMMVRLFANGPGDWHSIPGRVIPKTKKMVLDASLLNTQLYKVRIKGKVEKSKETSSAPLHLGVGAIEKRPFRSPSTMFANNNNGLIVGQAVFFRYGWQLV